VRQLLLTRATDTAQHEQGQDGGFVSAMLVWPACRTTYIEAAMVTAVEPTTAWKASRCGALLVDSRAGHSRDADTRTAPTRLRLREALDAGMTRLALVGMGCQTVVAAGDVGPQGRQGRQAVRVQHRALCSKTFDDAIFEELFEAKYGLKKADMVKMNIKGVFQIWMKDGSYHEIDLKECHQWTREGCKSCPDFAAEHSDIATGGIGEDNDWTLTIVRTELGEEVINRMIADGTIIARPRKRTRRR
jgi:coenzyme F420 hydrogenase subunit beta